MNLKIYQQQKQSFPEEISIIHIISLAPNGLTGYDLYRMLLLSGESTFEDKIVSFGEINKFIEEIAMIDCCTNFNVLVFYD
jgi:hypothetical protein